MNPGHEPQCGIGHPLIARPAAKRSSLNMASARRTAQLSYEQICLPPPIRRGPAATRSGRNRKQAAARSFAALPGQHGIELFPQGMEVKHVGGGIGDLGVGELLGAPIGKLLLLGNVDAEEVADQILEPVLVGIGAHQA